jgi:iron complex outermembrane receptor protein
MYTNRWKGIPTGAWGTVFDSHNSRTLDRFAHGEIAYDAPLWRNVAASARTTYDHYYYVGYFAYADVMNMDANWGHALGVELKLIWDPRPDNRVIVGMTRQQNLGARYRYWDVPEPVYYDKNSPYSTTSAYLQNEYQILANASVVLGLRHDRSSNAPASTTPRAGLVYHPTSTTTLKGLYGQAFRTPSNCELFWDNSNIGFRGNPDLKPEQIQTTEVVVEQRLGRCLQANVSAFKYHMHDLIDFVVDPADSIQVYQNAGTVSTGGVEVGVQARLPHEIAAFANYSFQNAHDQHDEDISNSPYHLATVGFSIPLRRVLSFAALAHAESGRRTVYGTQTASFATIDFNVTFAPQRWHESAFDRSRARTSLQIRVSNAFDAAYATPGGYEHAEDAITQDGRKISALLKVQL